MVTFDRGISVGYDCRWYASWKCVVTCALHSNFCRSHNSRDKHALRSLAIYSQSVCDSTPIAELIERQSRKALPARGTFVGADSLFPFYGRTQDVAVVSTCTLFYPRSGGAYSYAGSGTASTHFELPPPAIAVCSMHLANPNDRLWNRPHKARLKGRVAESNFQSFSDLNTPYRC